MRFAAFHWHDPRFADIGADFYVTEYTANSPYGDGGEGERIPADGEGGSRGTGARTDIGAGTVSMLMKGWRVFASVSLAYSCHRSSLWRGVLCRLRNSPSP
jgi:hypothetical protein